MEKTRSEQMKGNTRAKKDPSQVKSERVFFRVTKEQVRLAGGQSEANQLARQVFVREVEK